MNDFYTLDEAKKRYPEFVDVLSDKDITYNTNSFFDLVKKGEMENFNEQEDLSLQLLRLYWAQGFSLNDLKDYTGGKDLYHSLKKLNIPTMDSHYAHILKFSDKEYNERLVKQMVQKRLETQDRRAFEGEGEPVYIPRGPLNKEHKKHISEGPIKHYAEHPEKLAQMSQRQKEYFEEHPEQRKAMSIVMDYAWNKTREGKSVLKYMTKFFKKSNVEFSNSIITNPLSANNVQNEKLKQFWKTAPWAKEKFSIAVTKGWDSYKIHQEDEEMHKKAKDMTVRYFDEHKKITPYRLNMIPVPICQKAIYEALKDGVRGFDELFCGNVLVSHIEDEFQKNSGDIYNSFVDTCFDFIQGIKKETISGKFFSNKTYGAKLFVLIGNFEPIINRTLVTEDYPACVKNSRDFLEALGELCEEYKDEQTINTLNRLLRSNYDKIKACE